MRAAAPHPARTQSACIRICNQRWWLLDELEDGCWVGGEVLNEHPPIRHGLPEDGSDDDDIGGHLQCHVKRGEEAFPPRDA